MKTWFAAYWFDIAFILTLLTICIVLASVPVQAKPLVKAPEVETCMPVASADTIKIYYCENIKLYVNQFGFMAFEP